MSETPRSGDRRSVRPAVRRRLAELAERLERERPRSTLIETGFRLIARDREIAGAVLGGGLAYRLFFLTLALIVTLAGGIGFLDANGVGARSEELGLGESVVASVETAAEEAESGRWWLLIVGTVLALWFAFSLFRALRLVQAAAWGAPPPRLRRAPIAALNVLGCVVGMVAFTLLLSWMREEGALLGLIVAWIGGIAFFGAVWVLVSERLPSSDVPLRAHLPGAILFGVVLWGIQVFASVFLADKLASQAALYGVLGLAAAALFFLYLIGRGIVWAAVLNATVWDVRHRPTDADGPVVRSPDSAGRAGDAG
ncbi:MAG: YihY/virulence factor BrkB family protein [Miltoncostaeaceae bacterium]